MKSSVVWEGDTAFGHYQVVDTRYDGRPSRVLYSGDRQAAQSGIARDTRSDLLFDYNQRLFELATNLPPKRLLLIGGGVCSLPLALLAALPDTEIDVVELDSGLTELAHRFFGLQQTPRLRIFHTDGRSYLAEHRDSYDMIFVDAFSHTAIPRDLKTLEAFKAYAGHLKSGGILAMNIISGYHGPTSRVLRTMSTAANQTFQMVNIFLASRGYSLWLPQNFVLTAQKDTHLPLRDYLRHEAVQPLSVDQADVLLDEQLTD